MAHLSPIEKMKLEQLLGMSSGYVFDFSNVSFHRFIGDVVNVDIYNPRYELYGNSKANRLRAFWDTESDRVVGKLLEQLLEYGNARKSMNPDFAKGWNENLYQECYSIGFRLQGKDHFNKSAPSSNTQEDFLKKEMDEISVSTLKLDISVTDVLENRIIEIKHCLKAQASLAVIFLCGSILEGILLGVATKNPKNFNQSAKSPKLKDSEKVKPLHE